MDTKQFFLNWTPIGHRGVSGKFPENTFPAFEACLEAGVTWVECDLQLTADDEMVIIHDTQLHRTTNGTGAVTNHTLAELLSLDAGGVV